MMSVAEAARAIGARAFGTDAWFASVASDSRTLGAGALFVALRGERFDGHRFIDAARERGAIGALVDRAGEAACATSGLPGIVVEDTRAALARLAAHWRRRFSLPLVAVAGSNGKTTVKEMIAAILAAHYGADAVLATEGNLNNDIGVPLTVLRLRESHRAAVIELGMNHPGETAALAAIVQPTVALVNNAQREHQEFLHGVAEVAREHAAAFSALAPRGTAVINGDDPHAAFWREHARSVHAGADALSVVDFSLGAGSSVGAEARLCGSGAQVTLHVRGAHIEFTLAVPGMHNVRNAAAAAAAALAAGAAPTAVAAGLSAFRAVRGRLERRAGRNGSALIDDTYNANPDSVLAAIDVLAHAGGTRVLVLGDMGEVGAEGEAFHREVGRAAAARGIDALLALGPGAALAATAFGDQGVAHASAEALIEDVARRATPGATILVKGSRFMRMERVVAALAAEGP